MLSGDIYRGATTEVNRLSTIAASRESGPRNFVMGVVMRILALLVVNLVVIMDVVASRQGRTFRGSVVLCLRNGS